MCGNSYDIDSVMSLYMKLFETLKPLLLFAMASTSEKGVIFSG